MNRFVEKLGIDNVTFIAIEECSELQKELTKALRGKLRREALIEEMADVTIAMSWIKDAFDITDEELQKKLGEKLAKAEIKFIEGNEK